MTLLNSFSVKISAIGFKNKTAIFPSKNVLIFLDSNLKFRKYILRTFNMDLRSKITVGNFSQLNLESFNFDFTEGVENFLSKMTC